jgi:serine phosphatase RsbU (regulator of sigma subunit)
MLARYVEAGHEDQLEAAYTLGRESFEEGITLLGLLALHREAVEDLVRRKPGAAEPATLGATFGFLGEALGTFEMAQSGYRDAQERARLDRERAAREHAVALTLQQDLLPVDIPSAPGFEVAVRYRPGETGSHAGGDWYDVFELSDGRAGFVVGDVTGHGVGAAAAMGQLRVAVLAYAWAGFDPPAVVSAVDSLLDRLGGDRLASLVYVVSDPAKRELVVVNAGHPPPLLIDPLGAVTTISGGHDRLVGMRPPLDQRDSAAVTVEPGSRLLLYTDGILEQTERGGQDGLEHLTATVAGFQGSVEELCDLVLGKLAPSGTGDDVCLVAVESGAADHG